jgi:hypothetical protein
VRRKNVVVMINCVRTRTAYLTKPTWEQSGLSKDPCGSLMVMSKKQQGRRSGIRRSVRRVTGYLAVHPPSGISRRRTRAQGTCSDSVNFAFSTSDQSPGNQRMRAILEFIISAFNSVVCRVYFQRWLFHSSGPYTYTRDHHKMILSSGYPAPRFNSHSSFRLAFSSTVRW